jgi:hypothetical protein
MSRFQRAVLPGVILATVSGIGLANAKSCADLNGRSLNRGELYALYLAKNERTGRPELKNEYLYPGIAWETPIAFDEKVRLIYVIDPPGQLSRRNYAGTLAVRLVSTGANGVRQPPAHVMLARDSLPTGRWKRADWNGSVEAFRYYNFHRPSTFRASDSLLETTFHTTYTYRRGEERSTLASWERRSAFHFPEMRSVEPTQGYAGFLSRWFGGRALADGTESRFQSHIKYYPVAAAGHCVTIQPYLEATDNGALKVTITDLDDPDGLRAGSKTWNIRWVFPRRSVSR